MNPPKILGGDSQATCRKAWIIVGLLAQFSLFGAAIVINQAATDHPLASGLVSAAAILGGSIIIAVILLVYLVKLLDWYQGYLELRYEVRQLGRKLESSRGKLAETARLISELEKIRSQDTDKCKCVAIFRETRRDIQVSLGSEKLATMIVFGGPRRPASATPQHGALRHSCHNDSKPCRVPCILSPPALIAQTPTKHPTLRLRGGRRTRSLTLSFLVLLQRDNDLRLSAVRGDP